MGSQPIHVHFFRPDYQPQFKAAATYSEGEGIMISMDLVDSFALEDSGFRFSCTEPGLYMLDCRLTAVSITCLLFLGTIFSVLNFQVRHRIACRPLFYEEGSQLPQSASAVAMGAS